MPSERAVEAKSLSARYGPALGIAGVLIGLVIAGIALWRQPKSAARAGRIRSLAVLPFEVNTVDPKFAGLDKWIPVEIVSKLGQVTNLQVVNLPSKIEQLVSQKQSEDEIVPISRHDRERPKYRLAGFRSDSRNTIRQDDPIEPLRLTHDNGISRHNSWSSCFECNPQGKSRCSWSGPNDTALDM